MKSSEIEFDRIYTGKDGSLRKVVATFWGDKGWMVRYASGRNPIFSILIQRKSFAKWAVS